MATQRGTRVKKHITLSTNVAEALEVEARQAKVTLSEVIEAHVRAQQGGEAAVPSVLETRVEQLVLDMADLRAKVLPLVNTVTQMLRQMEGELPVTGEGEATTPPLPVVSHEEMYGPITPATTPPPPEQLVEATPRRRWRWRG
jgi:hypothetical protein